MIEGLFEWDEEKAATNRRKHGVSFEEAKTIFEDPLSRVVFDELGSTASEDRFVIIGVSALARTLVVVHCERHRRIRIISARKATFGERMKYEESLG